MKLKEWNEIKISHKPPYEDYRTCVEILKAGIAVIKYNFSNMNYRQATLRISDDETKILYKGKKSILEKSIDIAQLKGLLYGASSQTFKAHRKRILKTHALVQ